MLLSDREKIQQMKGLLSEGLSFGLTVTGGSMLPILKPKRDAVTVVPVEGKIRRGDILLYSHGEDAVRLHRVHRVKKDLLYLVGDAQVYLEPVLPSQVFGRVSVIRKEGGKEIPVTDFFYRVKVFFWQILRPFRPALFRLAGKLKRKNKTEKEKTD